MHQREGNEKTPSHFTEKETDSSWVKLRGLGKISPSLNSRVEILNREIVKQKCELS